MIKRKIFLDDSQNEAAIRQQFNRAVALARRNGSAIAIGHPHPATIKVLQQMLPQLPADIVLVRPSALLNEPVQSLSPDKTKPREPVKGQRLPAIKQCKAKASYVPEKIYADKLFILLGESLMQNRRSYLFSNIGNNILRQRRRQHLLMNRKRLKIQRNCHPRRRHNNRELALF